MERKSEEEKFEGNRHLIWGVVWDFGGIKMVECIKNVYQIPHLKI